MEAGTPVRAVSWQTIDNHLLIFFAADNEENVHGVMHLYSVNPVQILFLLCDFHKKYILCVLKLAAVSASHCTLVIKAMCPGVSMILHFTPFQIIDVVEARTVIPLRFSIAIESIMVSPLSTRPHFSVAPLANSRFSVTEVFPASM